jgi:hypothetical protein
MFVAAEQSCMLIPFLERQEAVVQQGHNCSLYLEDAVKELVFYANCAGEGVQVYLARSLLHCLVLFLVELGALCKHPTLFGHFRGLSCSRLGYVDPRCSLTLLLF